MSPTSESAGTESANTESADTVLTSIEDTPLSLDAVMAAAAHPRAGAVSIFVGAVRDHDGGTQGVVQLDYSAHPDAGRVLAEVATKVRERDGVLAVVAVHRRGQLAVGDLAVICAVSAEHRAEAFSACADLIEQLKARVPIWKHQQFDSGESQWVGL